MTQLHDACMSGDLDKVKQLLSQGADVNARDENRERRTPLLCACAMGHLHVAKYLIEEKNCSVEDKDQHDTTCLMNACCSGNLSLVKYLIEEKDCSIEKRNKRGYTCLMYASHTGHLHIVKYLVEEKNCNIEDTDNIGSTCLIYACWKGHISLVKYLIEERNANVNVKDNQGITCTLEACKEGRLDLLRYLVEEKHLNVAAKNNAGSNGLMLACYKGHLPTIRYLIDEHRISVEEKDIVGRTCLTWACRNNQISVVKHLIFNCMMDPPSMVERRACDMKMRKFLQELTSRFVKEHRQQKRAEMIKFLYDSGMDSEWNCRDNSAFHLNFPLRILHQYELIERIPLPHANLKVCLEDSKESLESSADSKLVTIYAQKERLRESCTFMKNLLSDDFNDVKDGTEENGMQTVHLRQELLQGCPSEWQKQLLIFLAWSQEGDQLHHRANPSHEGELSFLEVVRVLRYCRTCNALGLDVDVSAWIQLIEKYLETFNQEWIEATLKSGEVNQKANRCIRDIPPLDQEMFDLFTQVLEENDALYFFLLVNSAPGTLESPETIATECREWLLSPKASGKYSDTLKNSQFVGALHLETGIHFTTGIVFVPVGEEFVKRKRRRLK